MNNKSSLFLALVLMASLPASYAVIWDGGGVDANWNTAANWNPDAVPVPPVALTFTGTTQTTTNNNFAADSTFTGINFDNTSTGGSFTLAGNRITLNGGITTTGATGSPTQTISLDMILATSPTTTFNLALNNNVTVSGNITETGGAKPITVQGAGILTLTGSNTFSGDVNVSQGQLTVNSLANSGTASAIGTGSGISLSAGASSATLAYSGTLAGGHSTNRTITLAGTTGGAFFTANGTGPVTYNGILAVNNSASNKTLTLDGTSTAANAFASDISTGAGNVTVMKSGAGTWTLSGNNTFTRGVTLQVGQLNVNNASALGNGTFSISSNTTFDNTSGADIIMSTANAISVGRHFTFGGSKNLSFTGATTNFGVLENQTAYTWTLNGANSTLNLGTLVNKNVFNPINLTVNGSGNKLILEGLDLRNDGGAGKSLVILGSANIDITGAVFDTNVASPSAFAYSGTGTLTLSGANTYNGTTTVNSGTLVVAKQASLYNSTTASWTPAKITVASGGILALGVGDAASGYFDAAAVGTFLDATHMGNSTTTTGFKSGSILGFDTTNAGGSFTYTGNLTNLGTSATDGLAKLGTGTLILSGSNTYTGVTTINAGTLALGSANAVGTTGNITFGGGALQFSANNTTDYSARFKNSASAIAIDTNGQSLSLAAIGSTNSGGFTKSGAGSITFTAANTYSGETIVSAGTLILSTTGSINSSSGVAVASGATLTNDNAAAVTCSSLALTQGATLSGSGGGFAPTSLSITADLGSVAGGLVTLNTSLSAGGVLAMTLTTINAGNYALFTGGGPATLTVSSLMINTTNFGGLSGDLGGYHYILDASLKTLDITVVPEPATWAFLAFSLPTVMLLRRRRQD